MSGGIDSSFVALYLKKRRYKIIGLTFVNVNRETQREAISRAKRIANSLSIPHIVLDIKEIFGRRIIEPFCESFTQGETPNPCPFCNRIIKFGLIFQKIKNLGVNKIATGHYARVGFSFKTKRYFLRSAKDKKKDQSYFLWQLSQEQLSKVLSPLGDFKKEEVKKKVYQKFPKIFEDYRESQDVCFLRGKKLSQLLKEKIKENPGLILDLDGKIIGEHSGIHFFTIGQRSGLRIGAKSPKQKPFYVVEIWREKNAIVIGEEKHLFKRQLETRDLNWVSIRPPKGYLEARARIRYRHEEVGADIQLLSNKKAKVIFKKPQRAITPGQHIVFYKKNLLLGGGIIEKTK